MTQRLHIKDADFDLRFGKIVTDRRSASTNVTSDVATILNDVQLRGDIAVAALTAKFDRHTLDKDSDWRFGPDNFARAHEELDPDLRSALELAAERIRAFHEAQLPGDRDYVDDADVRLGARWLPVDAAGIYVPGGRAAYPSSLLMNAIPAQVAGVERIIAVSPSPKGECNPLVLAAAHLAGVDEMWRIGGAQAIAALAYGTDRIGRVDVITGPGNAWVAEAKRQLFGIVGIDMIAGPSEILVIADGQNKVEWIAADLLSQAEHDPSSQSILITDDAKFADRVADRIDVILAMLPTRKTALASWTKHGVIIELDDLGDLDQVADLTNQLAAEHVELAMDVDDAEALFAKIRHAGSVFLGRHTPEALGDYVAGPNHILPTGRSARFASGLSAQNFMKRTSFISASAKGLAAIGPAAVALSHAEGLPAHALSVEERLKP